MNQLNVIVITVTKMIEPSLKFKTELKQVNII